MKTYRLFCIENISSVLFAVVLFLCFAAGSALAQWGMYSGTFIGDMGSMGYGTRISYPIPSEGISSEATFAAVKIVPPYLPGALTPGAGDFDMSDYWAYKNPFIDLNLGGGFGTLRMVTAGDWIFGERVLPSVPMLDTRMWNSMLSNNIFQPNIIFPQQQQQYNSINTYWRESGSTPTLYPYPITYPITNPKPYLNPSPPYPIPYY